jgi:hypothetical protein
MQDPWTRHQICPGKDGNGILEVQVLASIEEQEKTNQVVGCKSNHPLLRKGSQGMKPPTTFSFSTYIEPSIYVHA